jgi:stage II sporulation protein M
MTKLKRRVVKRKGEMGFFGRNYSLAKKYLKDSKLFIYYVVVVFFIFALIGFFVPVPSNIEQMLLDLIKEIVQKTQGMNFFELFAYIFVNNTQSSFVGMLFGVFLGIFSMFVAIFNGYLLGFVASKTVSQEGILILWRLFPHGIFELPAIFISLGLGLKFGTFIFQKKKSEAFKNYFWNSLRVFFFIVLPLLFIAAIIETCLVSFFG